MDIEPGLTSPGAIADAQPGAFAAQQLMNPTSGGPPQQLQGMLAPVAGAAADPPLVDGPELEAESGADGSRQQVYNPEVLRVKLQSVPTVDKTLEEVEAAVRAACETEGIILFVDNSSRTHDGVSERYDMKKLMCRRGGADRQELYQRSLDAVPGRTRRQSRGSMKSRCPFEVTIRHAKSHLHPKVTNVKPDHNHVIDREAVAVKVRLAGKLTEDQKDQVAKMMTQGMKPKEVTTALRALYPDSFVNHRAVQNAAVAQTGAERPFDATDAYKQVMLATADGGVCEVNMDAEGRISHIWWQTREQVCPKEKGPTVQDKQILYADVSKRLGQAASILSDSMPPSVALALADSFLASVSRQAQTFNVVRRGGATFVPNPGGAGLPARASNARKRGAAETANSRTGSKPSASSGSA